MATATVWTCSVTGWLIAAQQMGTLKNSVCFSLRSLQLIILWQQNRFDKLRTLRLTRWCGFRIIVLLVCKHALVWVVVRDWWLTDDLDVLFLLLVLLLLPPSSLLSSLLSLLLLFKWMYIYLKTSKFKFLFGALQLVNFVNTGIGCSTAVEQTPPKQNSWGRGFESCKVPRFFIISSILWVMRP